MCVCKFRFGGVRGNNTYNVNLLIFECFIMPYIVINAHIYILEYLNRFQLGDQVSGQVLHPPRDRVSAPGDFEKFV